MSRRIMYIVFIALMLGLASGIAVGRDIKINFQQKGGEVPEGYFPDYGEPFGVRDSGFSYGWSRGIEGDSRDRNSSNAVDQRYDTLLHLQKGADAIWEIELPNGTYDLFMACGDPDNTDQIDTFDVEGVIVVDPDGQDNFDEYEVTVVVSDGRLTIKPASGSSNSKIMFVDIMGVVFSQAYSPTPEDGALYKDTWVSVIWKAGDTSASHNVYFGDSFNDVNDGTGDAFRGNQTLTDFTVGFSGLPYPDGLVPGTTYYWRIDEVEADGTTIHKGDVWSFSIPPRTAYSPDPADGAENVELDVKLTWTPGLGAQLNFVCFGDNFDDVNDMAGTLVGIATYTPGTLELAKTYYWRVDEFQAPFTHKGEVWSFTTEGAASGPNPANGAVDVKPTKVLTWDAGEVAASHDVYFGSDADAVKNATKASPEYKGPKALGEESYDPGMLLMNTTYYWRIDEVNDINPDSPWTGNVWNFTTGDFFAIDDFESYDVGNNEIWWAWKDGLGYVAHGNEPAYSGNGTGAAVGDETTASYTEETIVHDGSQSMPLWYDNNKQGYSMYSETELTLSTVRDWTAEGVTELSLWFYGDAANVAEPLYVAVSNSTGNPVVVVHDDPAAANVSTWTEWVIPLSTFADQGINLTNIDRIAIGLGTRGNTTIPGGSGKMYFDDIRLCQPREAAE